MEASNLSIIADYAGATLRRGDPHLIVKGVTTDSRRDQFGELFLALRGDNFDGHRFVDDSRARGAVGVVVERGFAFASLPPEYAVLEVDDTLQAYQRIAARYRQTLRARVVAITGSNGKTSTKDFVAAVLTCKYRVLKTEGNLNNHIGVPKMLLRAAAADEMLVLEMGMNHPGEIKPLAEMARPEVGIITNIGTAHIEFLGSREGIAQEKGMLAEAIRTGGHIILPAADEFSAALAARTKARVIMVGTENCPLRAERIEPHLGGSRFDLIAHGERMPATLSVPGGHMVTNALLAVATGLVYGVSLAECVNALSKAQLTKGRMELKHRHGLQILDDTYNANPDSMIAALTTLRQMPTTGRRIAILGRMGELGAASDTGHRSVGKAAAREKIDFLIGVGTEAELIVDSARDAGLRETLAVPDTSQAAKWLCANARAGDLILLKGSRSAAMERVLASFEQDRADYPHSDSPSPAVLANAS